MTFSELYGSPFGHCQTPLDIQRPAAPEGQLS